MVMKCPSCQAPLFILFYPELETEIKCACPQCSHAWKQKIRGCGKTIDWDEIKFRRLEARYRRQHRHDDPEEISDSPNFDAALRDFDHIARSGRELNDQLGDATNVRITSAQGLPGPRGRPKYRGHTTPRRRPKIDLAVRNAWIEAHKRPIKPC